jgi:hypothetical protein
MSKIRDLKTNPENSINIVNIVEMFSPDAKSKYTDMLLRLMKSTPNLKEHTKEKNHQECMEEKWELMVLDVERIREGLVKEGG